MAAFGGGVFLERIFILKLCNRAVAWFLFDFMNNYNKAVGDEVSLADGFVFCVNFDKKPAFASSLLLIPKRRYVLC